MGWIIAYLALALIAPTIFGMAVIDRRDDETKITLGDPDDALALGLFCLVWPLSITMRVIKMSKEAYKASRIREAKRIIDDYGFSESGRRRGDGDRTFILDVPEYALKVLLDVQRKGWIRLSTMTFEMIRDELMHRNAERDLLK